MSGNSLNIFQKVARQWDAMHPYNAAQLMRLPGQPDPSAIESCWRAALRDFGLGPVHLHGGRYAISPLNEHDSLLVIPPPGSDLQQFLTDEMNRPFDPIDGLPLRAFVLGVAGSFYFGVIYHHWIADSVSIRALLQQWFLHAYDPQQLPRHAPMKLANSGYWKRFGPGVSGWDPIAAILEISRWSSRLKRVRRVESKQFPDMKIRFTLHRLPVGSPDQLVRAARQAGATLNDLFLGAMAEACDRYVAAPPTPRRHDLALGVIVDLRAQAEALADVFGLYLGFTSILCRQEELTNWDQLVDSIARQNRAHKLRREAESSMFRMFAGLLIGRMLSKRRVLEFYRKRLPLAAGISNVNLNRSWVARYHPDPISEYIRVSPTGPMLPLVFTPTTLGESLQFGLTQRVSVIAAEVADACASDFTNRLLSVLKEPTVLQFPGSENRLRVV
ncbi:MAG: hypothetical protein JO353_08955 [Phycisphaerae bacterium]|nr:hypothetical protein [Phycisphaerae bacterium]